MPPPPPPATRLASAIGSLLKKLPRPIGQLLPRTTDAARSAGGDAGHAQLRVLAYEPKLPTGLPRAEEEFKNIDAQAASLEHSLGTSIAAQRFVRVSASMYESVELRETVIGLGAAVAAVYGIGVAESLAVLSSEFSLIRASISIMFPS